MTLFPIRPRIAMHVNLSDYDKEYKCFKAAVCLCFVAQKYRIYNLGIAGLIKGLQSTDVQNTPIKYLEIFKIRYLYYRGYHNY